MWRLFRLPGRSQVPDDRPDGFRETSSRKFPYSEAGPVQQIDTIYPTIIWRKNNFLKTIGR